MHFSVLIPLAFEIFIQDRLCTIVKFHLYESYELSFVVASMDIPPEPGSVAKYYLIMENPYG